MLNKTLSFNEAVLVLAGFIGTIAVASITSTKEVIFLLPVIVLAVYGFKLRRQTFIKADPSVARNQLWLKFWFGLALVTAAAVALIF